MFVVLLLELCWSVGLSLSWWSGIGCMWVKLRQCLGTLLLVLITKIYVFFNTVRIRFFQFLGGLERIKWNSINFNRKICFRIRVNWFTSSVLEPIKLVYQGTTVLE